LDKANSTKKKEFIDMAKVSCFKVLDRDSLNGDANFKLATIYYNNGANIIMKTMTLDTPIDSIPIYEEMANKLFLQSLPFMQRAFKSKPHCPKIIEGLMGIYYSLNDEENFKKYKALFDKLTEDIQKGLIKEDCI
ncbi:MAG: hypothetical protein IAF38_03145, partial [Bacteroidia bacterium]|nr:hypothetical protein [Bacteroidia bacterium]